jgi:hypothetical protein
MLQTEVDQEGLKEWTDMCGRISSKWPAGANEILKQKNQQLWESISRLESGANSFLIIKDKPKEVKKLWAKLLNEYERTCNMAIAYASRHLGAGQS